MQPKRRVVVTGLGLVTPLGNNVQTSWDGLINASNGVGPIQDFDATDYACRFAAQIKAFDPSAYLSKKDCKKMDSFIQYALYASIEAMQDAGLHSADDAICERMGVSIGSGIGGLGGIEKHYKVLLESGPGRMSPFFIPSVIINMAAGHVSMRFNALGPNISLVSACTTGTHNIGYALRTIQYGDADIMIAGGSEKGSTPLGLSGFAALKALSFRNDDPCRASRPFDANRDGFVLGDGAGIMVLEEYEHAKKRGATIYCEITGFGNSSDAHHMTLPDASGSGGYRCMRAAAHDAGLSLEDIDYINAHGTSTPPNDKIETLAINRLFGEHAKQLVVSSNKSMIGHSLGAAGAIEAVFTALTIKHNIVPPTINYETPDPDCNLDYVPNTAREYVVKHALSNSFGFGGTNSSLIISKL